VFPVESWRGGKNEKWPLKSRSLLAARSEGPERWEKTGKDGPV
jgi:hypothetical protein